LPEKYNNTFLIIFLFLNYQIQIKYRILKIIQIFNKEFIIQAIKFSLVGVVNTLLGLGTMFVLFNIFKLNYLSSNILGYCVGLINSYIWNKYFTFASKKSSIIEFSKFIIIFITSYLLNLIVVVFIVEVIKVNENISYIIGMIFYTIINFLGNKYITFRK